jgi:aldehyde:ferredoxin oxidoreductase
MGKILRVNMSDLKVIVEEIPKEYQKLGGRGLTSMIISKEVPPTCHPLGRHNKLVIAPGVLSGTNAANSGRLSVGCKSPLTGGIKESNVGGTSPYKIGRLGINAIVIEGFGERGKWYVLHLSKEGGKLIPAEEYRGLKNYELVKKLQARFGEKVGVLSIGPVGEMKLSTATVASTDVDGVPCRHAGRGGPGAVMGSKGLKAIVVDDTDGPGVSIANPEKFREGAKKFAKALMDYPLTGTLKTFGTNFLVAPIQAAGGYPTRNFREGTFEGADKVSGEYMHEVITKRGGKPTHLGCTTCVIHCSNVYVDEKGNFITASFEYETIWAQGANLGISDLDSIAKADRLCDEYGIDTIEIGQAIGVAMEAGIKAFGDAKGALELLEEVGKGTPLGRTLGSGSWVTGKVFGMTRVPAVKRQGMAAYEPRAIHGIGVTYATTPMGADHTAGWTVGRNLASMGGDLHPHKADGQVDASREAQINVAAMDSTGLCNFVNFPIGDAANAPDAGQGFLEMMSALYGSPMTFDDIKALGKKILKIERDFNLKAGFTKADDRLPEFMKEEKIPPHDVIFTVPDEELDRLFNF